VASYCTDLAFFGQELEQVCRGHLDRVHGNDGGGRLPVEGHRSQRVRIRLATNSRYRSTSGPPSGYRASPTTTPSAPIMGTSHDRTQAAHQPPGRYDPKITPYVGRCEAMGCRVPRSGEVDSTVGGLSMSLSTNWGHGWARVPACQRACQHFGLVCAARDSNPEPADSRHSMGVPTEPRLRSHSECLRRVHKGEAVRPHKDSLTLH